MWFLIIARYLRRCLASEGIVAFGVTLSRCVCACPSNCLYYVSTARRISLALGGEGNALYPVLSSTVSNEVSALHRFRGILTQFIQVGNLRVVTVSAFEQFFKVHA